MYRSTYRTGKFYSSNINFKIDKGEYVVLMGKTGSGKTTILEAICGLRKVKSGQIILSTIDVTHMTPGQREIGYVRKMGGHYL